MGLPLTALFALALAAVVAAGVTRARVRGRCRREGDRFLEGYAFDSETEVYRAARPRAFRGGPKAPRGVLLLHGYSGAPGNFGPLFGQLEGVGMPYYAPRLTGFGTRSLELLERIRFSDWRADALEAHDLLASQCREVSVVGYSMGGLLAHFVAERRELKDLIFLNPYFGLGPPEDRRTKHLALESAAGPLLRLLRPWFTKRLEEPDLLGDAAPGSTRGDPDFHHLALPSRSLLEVWGAQHAPRPESLRAERIHLVLGECDTVIDFEQLQLAVDTSKVPVTEHRFAGSPHGILAGPEQDAVATRLVQLVLGP